MRPFKLFTKYFFGKRGKVHEDINIVDGVVINTFESSIEDLDQSYIEELDVEDDDELLSYGFMDALLNEGKSERTVKEYCYDLKSFGNMTELDDLSEERINEELAKVSVPTARRKLSSLNSFAKWRAKTGETTLYLTLVFVDAPKKK